MGLIERVARFNDTAAGAALFSDDISSETLDHVIRSAQSDASFRGVDDAVVDAILRSCTTD